MTDTTSPASAGAQPMADANTIDSIIDSAETEATKEPVKPEASEPEAADDPKPDDSFPKKAVNALSRRDKQIGKQRAQIEQLNTELARLRTQGAPAQQGGDLSPAKTGVPTKLNERNYNNYAEYVDARSEEIADYKINQRFAERDNKQTETQRTTQEQAWVAERQQALAVAAQQFIKDNPDAQSVIDEHADLADEFPPQIQRAFLEAGELAPVAFYNLAKEGKLEDLASMSPARAAMEIGRAASQAPVKPKTKAPPPLPASRGSVPSGKSLDSMSGDELLKWVNAKD